MNWGKIVRGIQIGATVASGIGTLVAAIVGLKRYFLTQKENKEKLKRAADSNERLDYVFTTTVLPELEKVLDEVFSRNITSSKELALRLYRVMETISQAEKGLEPYLSSWKPNLVWTA